jgi:hypothetical protein
MARTNPTTGRPTRSSFSVAAGAHLSSTSTAPGASETRRDPNDARGPHRAGRSARSARSARSVAERCEDHIGVLYAAAYLQLGDRVAAEDAVIAAVARAAGVPVTPQGVTVSVWHVLAAQLQTHTVRSPAGQAVATTLLHALTDHEPKGI